ncbi:AvrD family protein [Arthrobacter sp. JUb115]|uniref:AvrD family protein n=1 Tax=Arthrobacter sp. JUb115 TaxID=2485108 RepID=UPI00336C2D92
MLPETQLISYNETAATLQAEHQFQLRPDYNRILPKGIESAYWPSLTAVDYLVLMGQLSQALLELRYQAGRSGTLWMRSVSLSTSSRPQPLDQSMTSAMTIVRDKYFQRAGRKIRDIAVEAVTSSGALLRADLAYEESA